MSFARRNTVAIISAIVVLTTASLAQTPNAATAVFPGAAWDRVEPSAAHYCQDKLDLATARVAELGTTAMTVVVGGRVLWEYGPQDAVSYLASVRKSILAMMYGNYVKSGAISLKATLADLKIDDVGGLLPSEREATVEDLLGARSGVYHEAANAACTGCGSTAGDPPGPRGSVPHGTYFLYNNWDFNALGTIFEQRTGENIYDVFARDFAAPMQMQDFRRDAQRKTEKPAASIHPAYHFYLSTRDMARVGYLMLREGNWSGRQLVPKDWTHRITTVITPVDQMHPDDVAKGPFGYGMLWWIWDGPFNTGIYKGGYSGIGAVGQFITVLPALDMVIAHKTQANSPKPVSRQQYLSVVDLIAAAKCGR